MKKMVVALIIVGSLFAPGIIIKANALIKEETEKKLEAIGAEVTRLLEQISSPPPSMLFDLEEVKKKRDAIEAEILIELEQAAPSTLILRNQEVNLHYRLENMRKLIKMMLAAAEKKAN